MKFNIRWVIILLSEDFISVCQLIRIEEIRSVVLNIDTVNYSDRRMISSHADFRYVINLQIVLLRAGCAPSCSAVYSTYV